MSATLPSTLDILYDSSCPERLSYDCIRIGDIESVLRTPIAKRALGHCECEELVLLTDGKISYSEFISNNVDAILRGDSASIAISRSQLLHVGIAALNAFLQSNVTGPVLPFSSAEVILPQRIREQVNVRRGLRNDILRSLTVDGEAAYKLTPNVELFCVAKSILNHPTLIDDQDTLCPPPLSAYAARLRVNFLHQKLLSEATGTLQTLIYNDLEVIRVALSRDLEKDSSSHTRHERARFLLERALIHIHHGFDAKARADLEQAASETQFEFALTGKLGKRTKFQDRDISQLVVLAKSVGEDLRLPSATQRDGAESTKPQSLDLNDDTLLESISFKKDGKSKEEKSMTVREESSLPQSLADVDPSNQPKLNPLDSIILLSLASAITNTSPEHGLTREETLPYATRVLEGGSSNWQVYSQALLVRSRIEGYKTRTVERSVLQLQALVDQVIADTASVSASESDGPVSTFLPRADESDSASVSERLEYIWLLGFSTRWDLEAELAARWVHLGGLRTALEIYERLQMWAEAALCYAATEREDKARLIVRKQLFHPSEPNAVRENDKFEGPEVSPLPADAPRLFCILGDIDKDPALYERAWEVSGKRYARAQRSLARHYISQKPPMFREAEQAYRASLQLNRLNHPAWFALGCVQLELEKWNDAVESFTRTVQLEDTDAEAWSNLAVALINIEPSTLDQNQRVNSETVAEDEEDEGDQEDGDKANESAKQIPQPYRNKRDALVALHRAARLKHSDDRIWDNVLTVSASIPPPHTPFRDIIQAQKHLIKLRGPKKGEKCVEVPILSVLVDTLTSDYSTPDTTGTNNNDNDSKNNSASTSSPFTVRPGTIPAEILRLLEEDVIPLITHSSALWLLVAKVEKWRQRPSRALLAHEKAWRATVASCTHGAFQMGDEKTWMRVVGATERLVKDGYATLGPMDKEREGNDTAVENEESKRADDDAEEMVAKDWRFKARSAVRGILGKGKTLWEDTEGWRLLKELAAEVSGGNH